ASDQTGVTAAELNLGPLANNGGPTPTHALLTGSFAIDTGVAPCPAADQRSVLRSDGLCDVGAYESVAMETAIDIKPGSDRNPINLKKRGVIPVALLGSAAFDVTNVDVTTLTFGPAGATPDHDLTDPDVYDSHILDVNDDGFFDLVSHYRVSDTGLLPEHTSACLSGVTYGGVAIGAMPISQLPARTSLQAGQRIILDGSIDTRGRIAVKQVRSPGVITRVPAELRKQLNAPPPPRRQIEPPASPAPVIRDPRPLNPPVFSPQDTPPGLPHEVRPPVFRPLDSPSERPAPIFRAPPPSLPPVFRPRVRPPAGPAPVIRAPLPSSPSVLSPAPGRLER
ncbi:MAG: hypothetical protein IIB62_06510, partial [Proteobacteria bacterium]|nr:hypothetical protein [Pseudomonadota bacterium]